MEESCRKEQGRRKKGLSKQVLVAAKIQKSKARNTDESVDSFDFSILCTNTLLHPWVTKQEKLALLVSLSRSHRPASLHPLCVSPLAPMLLITLPTLLSFRLFSSSIIPLLHSPCYLYLICLFLSKLLLLLCYQSMMV